MAIVIPKEFDLLRDQIRHAIVPIKPVDENTLARDDFLFNGVRAVSSKDLPEPYLIYFLFVELLGFRDLGKFEKLAWSIPIDFLGKAFLIEHRKLGVGIFVQDDGDFEHAKNIALLVNKSTRRALPYFKWKAAEAVRGSQFNVTNNSRYLFERYEFLRYLHKTKSNEADRRKDEVIKEQFKNWCSYRYPSYQLRQEANWLAMSAIDAFFSWTEHFFVHVAILKAHVSSGEDFSILSSSEWGNKFKKAFDVSDKVTKKHFDALLNIRKQQRNFIAHGAFGKNGETLHFHSAAGAVPVTLDVTLKTSQFMIGEGLSFNAIGAFEEIENFIKHLSSHENSIVWLYVQDWCLPTVITMAANGTYQRAMRSFDDMTQFVEYLSQQIDNAANMDW